MHLETLRKEAPPKQAAPARNYLAEISALQRQLESQKAEKLHTYTEYKLGRITREEFMAQKAMQTVEAKAITTRIQELQNAFEKQLAEDAAAKGSAPELDFLGQSSAAQSRDEMLRLMYQALDRVMVNVDGSLDVQWKFEDVFSKYEVTA